MRAAFIVMSILGCDDSGANCLPVASIEQQWQTIAACDASSETHLAKYVNINYPMVVLVCTYLVLLATMVYGPMAAWLVEMFPARIRYSSMSLPYHIGNGWFGGFLPVTSFAIVAATGNIYSGLWYPVVVAAATAILGMLFLRETKDDHLER